MGSQIEKLIEKAFTSLGGAKNGWSSRTIGPFPSHWPPTPETRLSLYVFAYRNDPQSPHIMHASIPFAEVSYDLELDDAKLAMLSEAITDLGIQGIQPIDPAEIRRLHALPPLPKVFAAAIAGPLSKGDADAIRALYAFERKCHGAAVNAIRGRHPALFDWLDAKPAS